MELSGRSLLRTCWRSTSARLLPHPSLHGGPAEINVTNTACGGKKRRKLMPLIRKTAAFRTDVESGHTGLGSQAAKNPVNWLKHIKDNKRREDDEIRNQWNEKMFDATFGGWFYWYLGKSNNLIEIKGENCNKADEGTEHLFKMAYKWHLRRAAERAEESFLLQKHEISWCLEKFTEKQKKPVHLKSVCVQSGHHITHNPGLKLVVLGSS